MRKTGMLLLALALTLFTSACSAPQSGDTKSTAIDAARIALTQRNCGMALTEILPFYNSETSDNPVRMMTASAYGCRAGIDFFSVLNAFAQNSSALSSGGFWGLLTQIFPSTAGDGVVEAANLGMDSLLAVLKDSALVPVANRLNWGSYNPGSTRAQDRGDDANLYMIFMSMAVLGSTGNRYGSPDPTTHIKTANLPWTTATTVTADGCAYASAMVNFADALGTLSFTVSGPIADGLQTVAQTFQSAIYAACDVGCRNLTLPAGPGGAWGASGCTVTTACSSCPQGLRSRSACQAVNTDQVSCAAAGITSLINTQVLGWN